MKKGQKCKCAEKGKIWGFVVLHDKNCELKKRSFSKK